MNNRSNILGASLVAGALAVAAPQFALAAGTVACTKIDNTASVAFKVGGFDQTPQNSTTATFYVGVKANVSVTTNDTSKVVVNPGSTGSATVNALSFRVTNNGNSHQKYALSVINEATNTVDPFGGSTKDGYDQTNVSIIGGSSIADLAPGDYQDVLVTSNTPISQTDGQVSVYALKAQTQWLGNGADVTADGQATAANIGGAVCSLLPAATNIDVVVADGQGTDDGARDGASSSRDAYLVSAANLIITKNSVVIYDPVNCSGSGQTPNCVDGSNNPTQPRLIPGAVVEYSISINNTASGTATVTLTDPLDTTNLTFYDDGYATTKGISVQAPGYNGGTLTKLTNGKDGDLADYNVTQANAVTVAGLAVAQGETAVVKFKATIK